MRPYVSTNNSGKKIERFNLLKRFKNVSIKVSAKFGPIPISSRGMKESYEKRGGHVSKPVFALTQGGASLDMGRSPTLTAAQFHETRLVAVAISLINIRLKAIRLLFRSTSTRYCIEMPILSVDNIYMHPVEFHKITS